MLTAAFSLVIEDALPNHSADRVVVVRWLVVLVAALLLLGGLWLRRRRLAGRGTLYYVRALDAAMGDGHLSSFQQASKNAHSDIRVVTRWLTRRPDADGVIDVADEIASLGRDLEQTMNEDDVSTAFNLAPNLLNPVALAVGYDLFWWPGSRLEEAPTHDGSRLRPGLSWEIPSRPLDHGYALDEGPRFPREEQLELFIGEEAAAGEACLVTARLTPGRDFHAAKVPVRYRYDVCVPDQAVEAGQIPRLSRPVSVQTQAPQPGQGPVSLDGTRQAAVHPARAAGLILRAVQQALHEHHGSPVLLYFRVPKTVQVAIGWGLANVVSEHGCLDEACLYPWNRLIPLLYGQGADAGQVLIHRVHRSQPTPQVMAHRARTGDTDPGLERELSAGGV
ncbi:MAG: hypothetical protein R2731_05115 [Nocardioides sp.]